MEKDTLFSEVYALDKSTNRYMIEIALDQYEDIFNEWDPAPFKRREIDADLELYLEGSAEEIPSRYPIELFFMVPRGKRDKRIEEETRNALRSFFEFKIYFLKRELQKNQHSHPELPCFRLPSAVGWQHLSRARLHQGLGCGADGGNLYWRVGVPLGSRFPILFQQSRNGSPLPHLYQAAECTCLVSRIASIGISQRLFLIDS
jgi:hypothetical protein